VVSHCVTLCVSQRSVIQETGILETLWSLVEKEGKNTLSLLICEFLQACIYANEYRYAFQQIAETWPLPTKDQGRNGDHGTTPVEIVLRYYYLRGVVCMGCDYDSLAIRCFWTCLSVPVASDTNAVSAIQVAAWKKMILLQCTSPIGILYTTTIATGENPSSKTMASSVPAVTAPTFTNPLSTPKDMAWDLVRFLSQAKPPPHARVSNPSKATSVPPTDMPHSAPRVDEVEGSRHVIEMEAAGFVVGDRRHGVAVASGDPASAPEVATHAAPRQYPSLGVCVYKQLVQAFVRIDRRKLDAILEECNDLFENDGNLGLVRRVGVALLQRHIYEWSRVYATISLEDLAGEMHLPTDVVHSSLLDLQTKLAWPVQLVPSSPSAPVEASPSSITVVFPPELPRPDLDTENNDISLVKQLNDLTNTVRQLDAAIAASPKYKAALAAADRRTTAPTSSMSVLGPMSVDEF
jgi:hypothetical protein